MKRHLLSIMMLLGACTSSSRPLTPIPSGISAEFPYALHTATIRGANMRYVDESGGELTFVLLHGNPTSSYLWRNVIPHLERLGRVVAPDMIGMGASAKPAIDYTFREQAERIEELLTKLQLRDVVLVLHDWGGPVGLHYANKHRDVIRGVVFFETLIGPFGSLEEHFGPATHDPAAPGFTDIFTAFRSGTAQDATPGSGWDLIVRRNSFIEQMLPKAIATRTLSLAELDHYRAPYLEEASRTPLFMWPREIPVEGKAVGGSTWGHDQLVAAEALLATSIPKLYLHATPGSGIISQAQDARARTWPEITVVDFGPGIHFLQEDDPHKIGTEIVRWTTQRLAR